MRYNQNDKTDPCADDSELRSDVTLDIFDEICSLTEKLKLDLDILNFENQCFKENLKYKTDIPLTAFIDFETTAPTDDCLDPENRRMFTVSYVIIFAFRPHNYQAKFWALVSAVVLSRLSHQ